MNKVFRNLAIAVSILLVCSVSFVVGLLAVSTYMLSNEERFMEYFHQHS